MPIPHWITRTNKVIANPLVLRISSHVAPLATVAHAGRRSGREYRTPVLAFRAPPATSITDGWHQPAVHVVLALAYGPDVDWLKNVEAAGTFRLVRSGRSYDVDQLYRAHGEPGLRLMPGWTRAILRAIHVDELLVGRALPAE